MWTDRTNALIGEEGLEKLKNSHVAVVGIGGVGGYVCVMLARAGVEKLTIVDFDKVDETNINRQVVATTARGARLKSVSTKILQKLCFKTILISLLTQLTAFQTRSNSFVFANRMALTLFLPWAREIELTFLILK